MLNRDPALFSRLENAISQTVFSTPQKTVYNTKSWGCTDRSPFTSPPHNGNFPYIEDVMANMDHQTRAIPPAGAVS